MALNGRATLSLLLKASLAPTGDHSGGAVSELSVDEAFASGTADRQCDAVFSDVRTLAGGANETLDFATLTDANGDTIAPAEVAAWAIYAAEDNPSTITIDLSVANAWNSVIAGTAPTVTLRAGEFIAGGAPLDGGPAVDASNKDIQFTNDSGGTAATYTIALLLRTS